MEHTQIELNKLIAEIILKKTTITENGCIEWTGSTNTQGYGSFTNPFSKKSTSLHRAIYELLIDTVPKNKEVCHKCDNRKCLNIDHLWIGTHKENMQDMADKNRGKNRKVYNVKGNSIEIIEKIQTLLSQGKSISEIQNEIKLTGVSNIIKRFNLTREKKDTAKLILKDTIKKYNLPDSYENVEKYFKNIENKD